MVAVPRGRTRWAAAAGGRAGVGAGGGGGGVAGGRRAEWPVPAAAQGAGLLRIPGPCVSSSCIALQ